MGCGESKTTAVAIPSITYPQSPYPETKNGKEFVVFYSSDRATKIILSKKGAEMFIQELQDVLDHFNKEGD